MFSSFLKFAVVIAGIGLFIGYLVHDPLPPDVPERSLAQFGCDIIAFIELLVGKTNKQTKEKFILFCNFSDVS